MTTKEFADSGALGGWAPRTGPRIRGFFNDGDRFRGTLRIGLWDPFQRLINEGLLTTY